MIWIIAAVLIAESLSVKLILNKIGKRLDRPHTGLLD